MYYEHTELGSITDAVTTIANNHYHRYISIVCIHTLFNTLQNLHTSPIMISIKGVLHVQGGVC